MLSPNGFVRDVLFYLFSQLSRGLLFVLILSRGLCFRGGEDYEFLKVSGTCPSSRGFELLHEQRPLNIPWWASSLSHKPRVVTQMGERVH